MIRVSLRSNARRRASIAISNVFSLSIRSVRPAATRDYSISNICMENQSGASLKSGRHMGGHHDKQQPSHHGQEKRTGSKYHGKHAQMHRKLTQISPILTHRVAECVELHVSNNGDSNSHIDVARTHSSPLAVVVGWMGAKESQLKSYHHFYHSHGMDTLTLCVGPRHVLYPEEAMKAVRSMMDKVIEISIDASRTEAAQAGSSGRPERSVVFHSFSMGGFLFGQALRAMQEAPQRYGVMPHLIRAQVFDSPPDFDGISTGISKSLGLPRFLESGARKIADMYLSATAETSGAHHRAASAAFHQNFVSAPALWYYSKADPIAEWRSCEQVIGKWRGRGTDVTVCSWDDTPHVLHAREHPERYFSTLQGFLEKASVIPASPRDET